MILNAWKDINNKQLANVYLLFGTEQFLLQEAVQRIIEKALHEDEKDFNLSVYDLEETPIEVAIEDAETLPFMGERRVVIGKNATFFTSEKTKDKVEHRINTLEKYIEEPAPYSILILLAPSEKLDERKKITKKVKTKANVIEGKSLNEKELQSWIEHTSKNEGTTFEKEAIDRLIILTNGQLTVINQEIKKLSTYVNKGEFITVKHVNELVVRSLEQNIFDLTDRVVNRKTAEALQIFYDLLKMNEEPIKILFLLVNQFRILYQVKQLSKAGYGQQQIASQLKVHPFRVKLASQQSSLYTEDELEKIIDDLATADYEMKTGRKDKKLLLELFIMKRTRA